MARVPWAQQKHLPEQQPRIGVRGLVFHSIVGSAEAAYGKFLNSSNLESTFILKLDGTLWQIMESDERADANGLGNAYYASCETEDNGDPDHFAWTPEQVDTMVRLALWYHAEHGVPLARIPQHGGYGFGWHVMHGLDHFQDGQQFKKGPSPWTAVKGKTCPGMVRQHQFDRIILPRILGQDTDDMPSEAFHRAETDRLIAAIRDENTRLITDQSKRFASVNKTVKAVRDYLAARFGPAPTPDA